MRMDIIIKELSLGLHFGLTRDAPPCAARCQSRICTSQQDLFLGAKNEPTRGAANSCVTGGIAGRCGDHSSSFGGCRWRICRTEQVRSTALSGSIRTGCQSVLHMIRAAPKLQRRPSASEACTHVGTQVTKAAAVDTSMAGTVRQGRPCGGCRPSIQSGTAGSCSWSCLQSSLCKCHSPRLAVVASGHA